MKNLEHWDPSISEPEKQKIIEAIEKSDALKNAVPEEQDSEYHAAHSLDRGLPKHTTPSDRQHGNILMSRIHAEKHLDDAISIQKKSIAHSDRAMMEIYDSDEYQQLDAEIKKLKDMQKQIVDTITALQTEIARAGTDATQQNSPTVLHNSSWLYDNVESYEDIISTHDVGKMTAEVARLKQKLKEFDATIAEAEAALDSKLDEASALGNYDGRLN